ncbi:MAG: ScpA family protein [Gammaproteobacteria bacterium]
MEAVIESQTTEVMSPIAIVQGENWVTLPEDLYIPPDALKIFLETFQGPLDLLLYLIKKQNIDILNIPMAEITRQYVEYVELMRELHFELAAEYLLMAAMLAEIKSRMLLPRVSEDEENEEDPRAELIRRLQEYEQFKQAAEALDTLPREGRDVFSVSIEKPEIKISAPEPEVAFRDLLFALKDVLTRAKMNESHHVHLEPLSVRDSMTKILSTITMDEFTEFRYLFEPTKGRLSVVVTFLALLELLKLAAIELVQNEPFSNIYVKKITTESTIDLSEIVA